MNRELKTWETICGDCEQRYTSKSSQWNDQPPARCGFCGSTFVAVRVHPVAIVEMRDSKGQLTCGRFLMSSLEGAFLAFDRFQDGEAEAGYRPAGCTFPIPCWLEPCTFALPATCAV